METAVSNLNILVVDDDDAMRELVARMLKRMKAADVRLAESGEQALRQLEGGSQIDLVIADWNMSGMSGLELFKKVRAARPQLPFLLLTGRDDAASIVAAKTSGVPAYIVKPVTPQELDVKIAYLLRGA
jgi:DNA-binding response OmpR family regulator